MAWNQPGGNNNNPWGKKPSPGGGDLDQAFKDWQKRMEGMFGSGGGNLLVVLLIIAVALWLATGFYSINLGSSGVVQRFGKYEATVPNGWGWRLPWPIETVTEVDTAGNKASTFKSRVLTSEPNLVELDMTVQWRIQDPVQFLFNVLEPEKTLEQISESAIREVVGRNDQQAILASSRVKITQDTRAILQRTLDAYRAGIEILTVNIEGAQVPEAVQQAQSESVKAQADRERDILAARAYANEILPKAEGAAAREIQGAEADKAKAIQQATGDVARFNQLVTAYERAPGVTRERLYLETVESVLRGSRKVIIDSKNTNGNMLYLPLDKLTERRAESETSTVTVRPPIPVEPESATNVDPRQKVER